MYFIKEYPWRRRKPHWLSFYLFPPTQLNICARTEGRECCRALPDENDFGRTLNQCLKSDLLEAFVPGGATLLASHVSFGIGSLTWIIGMFSVNLKSIKVK